MPTVSFSEVDMRAGQYGTSSTSVNVMLDSLLQAAGWTRFDAISTTISTWDVVYQSKGVTPTIGDARIYIRVFVDTSTTFSLSATKIQGFSFWDTTGHSGVGPMGNDDDCIPDDATFTRHDINGICNEYELTLAYRDDLGTAGDGFISFGSLDRSTSLPSTMTGWAATTALVTGAGAAPAITTIPVDRDLRGLIQYGQPVQVISQSVSAPDASTWAQSQLRVVDVTAANIKVEGMTKSFNTGAVVGLNPMPTYVASIRAGTTTLLAGETPIRPDAGVSSSGYAITFYPAGSDVTTVQPTNWGSSEETNLLPMWPVVAKHTGDDGVAGSPRFWCYGTNHYTPSYGFSGGVGRAAQRWLVGLCRDPDDAYITLLGSSLVTSDGQLYLIGPGAHPFPSAHLTAAMNMSITV